jgi:hypothetical protein
MAKASCMENIRIARVISSLLQANREREPHGPFALSGIRAGDEGRKNAHRQEPLRSIANRGSGEGVLGVNTDILDFWPAL